MAESAIFKEDRTVWQRDDGLTVISRHAFFANGHFDYKPGQHVVFGGPSQKGKTSMAFDALEYVATPKLPAYIAVSKPSDKVTAQRSKALDFYRVEEWPPPTKLRHIFGEKPRGYVIWPKFGNIDTDFQRCAMVTATLMGDRYTAGVHDQQGILVMDDTMVKAKIMGLDNQMVTILAMAGAMGIGLWVFVQKPTDSGRTTLWAYENADHLFFTKGGDRKMLMRYSEIAGDQGEIVKYAVPTLDPFQFLYFNKPEGYVCIVDKK